MEEDPELVKKCISGINTIHSDILTSFHGSGIIFKTSLLQSGEFSIRCDILEGYYFKVRFPIILKIEHHTFSIKILSAIKNYLPKNAKIYLKNVVVTEYKLDGENLAVNLIVNVYLENPDLAVYLTEEDPDFYSFLSAI